MATCTVTLAGFLLGTVLAFMMAVTALQRSVGGTIGQAVIRLQSALAGSGLGLLALLLVPEEEAAEGPREEGGRRPLPQRGLVGGLRHQAAPAQLVEHVAHGTDPFAVRRRGALSADPEQGRARAGISTLRGAFNKLGYHYPQQRIITLWDDVLPTINKFGRRDSSVAWTWKGFGNSSREAMQ